MKLIFIRTFQTIFITRTFFSSSSMSTTTGIQFLPLRPLPLSNSSDSVQLSQCYESALYSLSRPRYPVTLTQPSTLAGSASAASIWSWYAFGIFSPSWAFNRAIEISTAYSWGTIGAARAMTRTVRVRRIVIAFIVAELRV